MPVSGMPAAGMLTAGTSAGTGTAQAGAMSMTAGTAADGGRGGSTPSQTAGTGMPTPQAGTGETKPETPPQTCAANMEKNPADADPCKAPLRPGEDRKCMFSYMGQMRKFYIYAPPSYNACEPAALVIDSHGASESAEVHIGVDRFSADAPLGYGSSWRLAVQGDNAIVVTPEGIGLRWNRSSDPAFLNTVADMVEATAKVDPEKRYLTGISMGGMITVATGCPDTKRWRGLVPVAMLSNPCDKIDRPIPHLAFHARGDQLTSYADDQALAQKMATLNGCGMTPQTVNYGGPMTSPDPVCFKEPYGIGSPDAKDPYNIPLSACPMDRPVSSCQVWTGCNEGVEVRFCTVAADKQQLGGHLLYRNDTSLALGPLAWQFLKKFWK
jgi:poly(3-hydroxybutyrate) depolymerase